MIIFKRKSVSESNPKDGFYTEINGDAHRVVENFKNKKGLPITKQILEDIHKLYLGSQIAEDELHKKAPSLEGAVMEASFATEISNYFSRICYHISLLYGKEWSILLRPELGELTPDIIITEWKTPKAEELSPKKIKAVIELRTKEWIQALMAENEWKNRWAGKKEKVDIYSEEGKTHFQKYTEQLGVSLDDIFVVLPTLPVGEQNAIETIAQQQERFAQSTGIPKENLVILSENKPSPEVDALTNLTTYFEKFIQKLLKK